MPSTRLRTALIVAIAATPFMIGVASPASAATSERTSPATTASGHASPECSPGCEGAQFEANGVNIRACASASCTVVGLGYEDQRAGTICGETPFYKNGYLHIEDETTGVYGWASTQYTLGGCD